jgi:hypothetical protein
MAIINTGFGYLILRSVILTKSAKSFNLALEQKDKTK